MILVGATDGNLDVDGDPDGCIDEEGFGLGPLIELGLITFDGDDVEGTTVGSKLATVLGAKLGSIELGLINFVGDAVDGCGSRGGSSDWDEQVWTLRCLCHSILSRRRASPHAVVNH